MIFGIIHSCTGRQSKTARDTLKRLAIDYPGRTLEIASENIDVSPLLDDLRQLEENPLNIAQATAAELQQIPGVGPQTAYRIVSFRQQHSIDSREDLENVPGIEPELVDALKRYVTFSGHTPRDARSPSLSIRTRVVRKFSQSSSSEADQYAGSPEKVYNRIAGRFIFSATRGPHSTMEGLDGASISFGALASKDPGEKDYADLVRGHLEINIPAYDARVVLGDYFVAGGQGLVLWRPTGFSKGSEATSGVARNGTGVRPSLSSGQSTFRGVGINFQPRGVGAHLFYSDKRQDGTTDSEGTIVRLSTDDLHRTEGELSKKNQLRETTLGGRITFDPADGVNIGVSGFISRFDNMVALGGPFGFRGNQMSAVGLDGSYVDGSVSAFAEMARDHSRATAAVVGFSASLRPDLSIAFICRSYSMGYNNFHSSGFGESGDGCKNESGVYSGLTWNLSPWLRLAAYADQFLFPWRSFGSLMTSQGHEYLFGADVKVRENLEIELRFRQKEKVESNSVREVGENVQPGVECSGRDTYRASLRFEPAGWLRWQNRLEIVTAILEHKAAKERGILFFQDLAADLGHGFSLSFRVVAFSTESYNSRVYEYEADLPGAYSSPALFETGLRWYVLGRFRWGESLVLAVKYSQTSKDIPGQRGVGGDRQVGVQLDLAL